jgi:prophage tail gpP-like protein
LTPSASSVSDVVLTVEGKAYAGWEEIDATRTMEALCAGFRLKVSDKSADESGLFPVPEGAACELAIGGELWLSGYVDAIDCSYSLREHSVTVEGRDLAEDLVDCVPAGLDVEYYEVGLEELATTLAEPFGISVLVQPGLDLGDPFQVFGLRPGETAHEALERACRLRRVLLGSTAAGAVLLTQAATGRASVGLRQGVNVISASIRLDRSARFSRYYVRGQQPGSALAWGSDCAELEGVAIDPDPRQERTTVIVAETAVDDVRALERAQWEATTRAARGSTLSVTVAGWRQNVTSGPIWVPNQVVQVAIPKVRAGGDWLISGVRFHRSRSRGTVTDLSLTRVDAWIPEPPRIEDEPVFGADLSSGGDQGELDAPP